MHMTITNRQDPMNTVFIAILFSGYVIRFAEMILLLNPSVPWPLLTAVRNVPLAKS